uniref:Uncharacterized protein n=1 Tax=Rhizophagus irregularis (strain DAOM 181602 / DAOM 197198 / MUCL 43194) TaxID=747089 RepID=U9UE24_RHIID
MQTSVGQSANISTPLTPPDRIYMELANMAVKKYKKTTPLTEEVIVDIIINWRLGEDSNSDLDSVDEEPGELRLKPQPKLKNKIILRRKKFEESEGMAEAKVKLTELEEIFTTTSNDMEWQHITLYRHKSGIK